MDDAGGPNPPRQQLQHSDLSSRPKNRIGNTRHGTELSTTNWGIWGLMLSVGGNKEEKLLTTADMYERRHVGNA